MKWFKFNIKDRKVLSIFLCLIIIFIFTLTIAYAALSAVLTISGNTEVVSSTWDIYLDNVQVKSGSVTTAVPTITSDKSLTFNTTLNVPGDYYEFTVDIVNSGSIDAMIEKVTKTPELTIEQLKYLKYEVSYANGESITSKQTLAKKTSMPIKVSVEYRKDLVAADLPTEQVQLTLGLVLDYVQSDGSGTTVKDNGVASIITANGNIEDIGTIVTIGSEKFYTIGTEGDNVKLLSMYNLYVGNIVYEDGSIVPIPNPTGLQSSDARGFIEGKYPIVGTIMYSDSRDGSYDDKIGGVSYGSGLLESYMNNYKTEIEKFGINVSSVRPITMDDVNDSDTFDCSEYDYCSSQFPWIYSTTYWTYVSGYNFEVPVIYSSGEVDMVSCSDEQTAGVRPVVIISKDLIADVEMITFKVNNNTFEAEEGMTWSEFVNSSYSLSNFSLSGDSVLYGSKWVVLNNGMTFVKNTDIITKDYNYLAASGGAN